MIGAIERITVELPAEVLREIRASVRAGLYSDVGAALAHHWRAGAAAEEDDVEITAWLNGPGGAAYRKFDEGRLSTVSHAELLAQISADRAIDNPDNPPRREPGPYFASGRAGHSRLSAMAVSPGWSAHRRSLY